MSQSVWRIATDTPDYTSDDMTGAGAKKSGGRWNRIGVAIMYTASSRALACLETIVHLNSGGLPLNRYLIEIEIPDAVWSSALTVNPARLAGWDAEPAGMASIDFGTEWATSKRTALLIVPSAIVQEELNILINPHHIDVRNIVAHKRRKWLYDPRLQSTS